MKRYYKLEELVKAIEGKNGKICEKILADNINLFKTVQGSSNNHQAWKGGYYDHVMECMNFAIYLYDCMSYLRKLDFTISDALLILFLHDIEKPWKYDIVEGKAVIKESLYSKDAQKDFREKQLHKYGIKLTPDQENAMKYVEGEYKDYSPQRRTMNELAAFCHMCDMASARIWHNQPQNDDAWSGKF